MIVVPPGPVSFSADVLPIFRSGCDGVGCHIGFQASGVDLSTYTATVNSVGVQYGETIVKPGDGSNSALVDKLTSSPEFGQRMPIGTQLSATDIEIIRTWIDEGASNN
ncbi:MAG: hypothetical protein HKN13_15250 [Rhodothermales bacterium]|nr:hypothetical protein [Rhodothermales bacterium]